MRGCFRRLLAISRKPAVVHARRVLVRLLITIVVLFIAWVVLWPRVGSGPPSSHSRCLNNLKTIALALCSYHSQYGSYPPPSIVDSAGVPLHSWRVLILPQLEERELFEEYDFSEPWNGPNNRRLIDKMPQVFACPRALKHGQPNSATSYLAVIGPGTAWSEHSMDLDGSAENSRILVAEVAHSRLKWTEPEDLTLAEALRGINVPGGECISSMHIQGANVAMSDGAIRYLSADLSLEELEFLLTGGTVPRE